MSHLRLVIIFSIFTSFTAAFAASSLDGTWSTQCLSPADGFPKVQSLTFRGSRVALQYDFYMNQGCSDLLAIMQSYGDFAIGGRVPTANAQVVDIRMGQTTLTPQSDEAVQGLDQLSMCGYGDWQLQVPTIISGLTCQTQGRIPANGEMVYDIVGLGQGTLQLGLVSGAQDRTSPERRPTVLDQSASYYRVR